MMFIKKLALLTVLLAGACAPMPDGFAFTNSEPAVRALLLLHGANPDRQPRIWGVHLDPSCTVQTPHGPGVAFRDPAGDVCVGGLIVGDDIFLVWTDHLRYSDSSLSHEIVHWLAGDDDHRRLDLWSKHSGDKSKEYLGEHTLWGLGAGNTMKLF